MIADSHLAVRVLLNGQQILEAPLLFDVTRHQLMLAASRTAHDVVEGTLLMPDLKHSNIVINPAEVHQTMLGFGGSPSIAAYAEVSDEGKREYWQTLKRYNLLLFREYPMGEALKPDLSNLDDLADATPHYYGDNFPNSEVSSFDYSKHILALGGGVIYESLGPSLVGHGPPTAPTPPTPGASPSSAWRTPMSMPASSSPIAGRRRPPPARRPPSSALRTKSISRPKFLMPWQ